MSQRLPWHDIQGDAWMEVIQNLQLLKRPKQRQQLFVVLQDLLPFW